MAELVDALDLGSSIARCAGSTPAARTTQRKHMSTPDELIKELQNQHRRFYYEVAPRGFGLFGWKISNTTEQPSKTFATFSSKIEATTYARQYMIDLWRQEAMITELTIKNHWGRIQEKNTYPRSSDPREFKG